MTWDWNTILEFAVIQHFSHFTSCIVCSNLLHLCVIVKAERSVEDRPERFGPAQQHRRQLALLNKQITQKTKEVEEVIHIHTPTSYYSFENTDTTVIVSSLCLYLHCFLIIQLQSKQQEARAACEDAKIN